MRTVCAYSLWFPRQGAADEVWRELTGSIVRWYKASEWEVALPLGWEDGMPARITPTAGHELDCTASRIAGAPGPLRELRWSYPDVGDDSLLWTVDAAALACDGAIFTLQLRLASADFELFPARFALRTPRVIQTLVARGDAHVGVHPVGLEPRRVDPDEVPALATLLLEQSRRHPVVVISPEPTGDTYAVDATTVAAGLAGLASVYVLASRWAGFALTDELGKRLSCYHGAVRVYWPRLTRASDPFTHPLWLPPQIADFGAPDGFARFLLRTIAGVASFRFAEPEPIRSFRARLDDARVGTLRARKDTDYEALFEEYVRLDVQARDLRDQLDAALRENAGLRAELATRWTPSTDDRAAGRPMAIDDRPELETVVDAVEAARARTSHVIYLDEAVQSARESPYRHPDRVYSALLAIDDVARRWAEHLAGGPKLGPRRDAFRQCGFDYKDDISKTAEGKWGTEYTYNYDGRRIVFAPHITLGAKSADRCLSIHLHWDEPRRKVVIAHVGRHKTNTLS